MNANHKVLVSVAVFLAACLGHAADSKVIPYVMSIVEVETDDPSGYATWIAQYNAVAKTRLGIDNYLRVYQGVFDSRDIGPVRAVASAASVAELMKNNAALENDPGIHTNREHLRHIRKTASRVLYQAVRREGSHAKNHNFSTLAMVSDEAGYLTAIEQLRGIFDSIGLNDAKIGVYRVLVGRTDHTHRITINLPSSERLAAFLDIMASNQQTAEWIANSAKYRTVVANFAASEITK